MSLSARLETKKYERTKIIVCILYLFSFHTTGTTDKINLFRNFLLRVYSGSFP